VSTYQYFMLQDKCNALYRLLVSDLKTEEHLALDVRIDFSGHEISTYHSI